MNRTPSEARGFTLVEVLVAAFALVVGLTAVVTGLQYAKGGIEAARGETTAAFLAEQRLEHLKALSLASWPAADLRAGTTVEAYGSIANAPAYRRQRHHRQPRRDLRRALQARAGDGLLPARHGSGQLDQERRLDVVTMLMSRI